VLTKASLRTLQYMIIFRTNYHVHTYLANASLNPR
jgi:hypothetical protein